MSVIRKLVPHLGWNVEYFCTEAVVKGSPFSNANTGLCSAPWYSYTRRMSFHSETPQINRRNSPSRIALGGRIVFNLVDGAIRLGLFLLFIWGVSLWKDIRRVYEYHGAEHKTVFAFENGDPLTTASVQKYSTFHPRCGTSFLMTVMLISIGFYMLVPFTTFWARFASRIVLLPVIAGVSYEIIRFAAKHRGSLFALMTAPGLWLQRITTKPPSDEQAHCAIVALDRAMDLEKAHGGELVIA